MKGEASFRYLAKRIAELEYEKAMLLGQLAEFKEQMNQLEKEVEQWRQQPNKKDGESDI